MPMMHIFSSVPGIGIEITSKTVRLAALAVKSGSASFISHSALLPDDAVAEVFSPFSIKDPNALASTLQSCLQKVSKLKSRRVGIALPDSLFRVQTFDFDELPSGNSDRERLIRWRFEKCAAFDVSDTALRYQIMQRHNGASVFACIAKNDVITFYEKMIKDAEYEPWSIAPASFHALNFYSPIISPQNSGASAFAWFSEKFYATIVLEVGQPQFYRFREIKSASSDAVDRIAREIEDSLHFYTHKDRVRPSQISRLYLAGENGLVDSIADTLRDALLLNVDVLIPAAVVPSRDDILPAFAPALGAGGCL